MVWGEAANYRDDCKKVFACKDSPDIFGYYGHVLVPQKVLPQLEETPILATYDTSEKRHSALRTLAESCVNALPATHRAEFGIVHASRDGVEMKSAFRLWHLHWTAQDEWIDEEIAIGYDSVPLIECGSGARVVRNKTDASKIELGVVSRAVFTGFCDGLASDGDPFTGGVPQLVGLRRHGMGMHFGIVYGGKRYYRGDDRISFLDPLDVQWKNELFENCSAITGARLSNAQLQPRLKKR